MQPMHWSTLAVCVFAQERRDPQLSSAVTQLAMHEFLGVTPAAGGSSAKTAGNMAFNHEGSQIGLYIAGEE
ncbi:uncharacterized protein VTP21DRAFT_4275 [Calcarisporiella thermophila]|uniref:uncharacterized protein n=1 Tax=Calcarisporiella thermophila TaxID=911321 RepID=UPI003742E9B1